MPSTGPGIVIALEVAVLVFQVSIMVLENSGNAVIQESARLGIGTGIFGECSILVIDVQIVQFFNERSGLQVKVVLVMVGRLKIEILTIKVTAISSVVEPAIKVVGQPLIPYCLIDRALLIEGEGDL